MHESDMIAQDIAKAFRFDSYLNEVAPSFRNLTGATRTYRALTVNTGIGFTPDIHFNRKTPIWRRQEQWRWGTASTFKGCTVFTEGGTVHIIKDGRIISKKRFNI